jgi:hypothetical protein
MQKLSDMQLAKAAAGFGGGAVFCNFRTENSKNSEGTASLPAVISRAKPSAAQDFRREPRCCPLIISRRNRKNSEIATRRMASPAQS